MSDDACPYCGIKYRDFRTGETFQSIKDLLWVSSDDPNDWVYRRRNTVLGKWREIKLNMWDDHKQTCRGFYMSERVERAKKIIQDIGKDDDLTLREIAEQLEDIYNTLEIEMSAVMDSINEEDEDLDF